MIIQSVHRAMQILGIFSLSEYRLGISEMSRLLNLNKGTVQGLVRTLVHEGFLKQDQETRKYQLGLRLYELGVISAGSLEINQRSSMLAHELAKRTQQLVRIAIFDKDSAMVTLDAYPRSEPFLSRHLGPRAPLYCTALGKALLAFSEQGELDAYLEQAELTPYTPKTITEKDHLLKELQETKQRGYSINKEEHLFGRTAIGAPIFGRNGRLAASICLVGNKSKILGKNMKNLAEEVKRTALEISRQMGYFPEAISA